MCGITGLLRTGSPRVELAAAAAAMGATLGHRGPDDSGLWVDEPAGVAFAHRRLAIIDLSPLGHQPMTSASGRYVICYNGEVYNFQEMREELAARGAKFRGGNDTEVILAALEAWGVEAAVQRFIGMFVFALWDKTRRALTLTRDRLGIKPLYWGEHNGLFLFGSELKALTACPGCTLEVDRDALAAFVRWNYVPSPHCIYRGIRKLEPGTMLTVRAGQSPRVTRYWDMRRVAREGVANPLRRSDEWASDRLEELLKDAVKRRMVADVPLGVFLSGGTDSSLVAALMQAQSDRPVRTFTIGFREPDYNEAVHAKAVATHLGTDHTELYVEPAHALSVIPDLPRHYDEPFADSSQVPTFLVSEMTRRHVGVALSGDGGDELFAGYTRYHWAEMVRRRFGGLPRPVRAALGSLIAAGPASLWELAARPLPAGRRPQRIGERAHKLAGFLREPDEDAIYRRQHSRWSNPAEIVLGGNEPRGIAFDPTVANEIPGFIERMQFLDTVTYMPDDILTKVDRASMAVSLEARVPLIDHRVVEFVWRLPFSMKVRAGTDKWLLRQVLYRYVPREIIERPKMGFGVPIGRWLRGPLRDWAEALLGERRLKEEGFLESRPIRRTWDDFLAGRSPSQEPLWVVLMFQAWQDVHLRGVEPDAGARQQAQSDCGTPPPVSGRPGQKAPSPHNV
ncbi:MAG: asparagine synthase (glutamine-hydrolyzing) [Kiloniellaceae bacterium]